MNRPIHEPTTLAVDVGQTGSRLLLTHADGTVERSAGPGGRAGEDAEEALVAIVGDALGRLPTPPASIDTLCAGLTGLQGRPGRAAEVLDELGRRLPVGRVVLADDSFTAYVGALGLRPGVVVAAGTGAVAVASDGSSRHARIDGRGYLLGDLGSGYWIGRRGLEAALLALDGRAGSRALLRRARSSYGELESLPQRLAADPDRVGVVARFAEDVADAARTGDETALAIWRDAADHLAGAVAAAWNQLGLSAKNVSVSWGGRLFAAGAVLTEPFADALARRFPGAVLRPPAGDGLDGAQRLAVSDRLPDVHPLLATATAEAVVS